MAKNSVCVFVCLTLTHPDLSEAALAQFEFQAKRFTWDLPGVFSQALSLRLHSRTDCSEPVTESICVL